MILKRLRGQTVLIVDDELAIRKALEQRFLEESCRVATANSLTEARQKIADNEFSLILLDHRLPDGMGLSFLEEFKRNGCPTPVIMMTAYGSIEDAVRAMKADAWDYLIKPFDLDEVVLLADRALEAQYLRDEVARFRAKDRAGSELSQLIGSSPAMEELRDFIDRVSQSGARTILIHGESGTGKDLVARAIHYSSPEADCPFLNITCTALPETLLESELFGYEKGAFTDAKRAKRGLFEEAVGGTIFLDEIGDLPLSLQGKLLRFLESKSFRRIGGLREITVDVRVVAATNRNLLQAIEDGQFRSDLYYRLNVIPVEIPPLRQRSTDVKDLVLHFSRYFAKELRKSPVEFNEEALAVMAKYSWPGNVRELRNCVERVVLLSRDRHIGVKDLPRELQRDPAAAGSASAGGYVLPEGGIVLEDHIRDLLDQALERCHGNKSNAAATLGIHRDQVRYWVKKYGLTKWIRTKPKKVSAEKESQS